MSRIYFFVSFLFISFTGYSQLLSGTIIYERVTQVKMNNFLTEANQSVLKKRYELLFSENQSLFQSLVEFREENIVSVGGYNVKVCNDDDDDVTYISSIQKQ